MSTEENKATVRRLVEQVWNEGNLAVFDQIYAPNFVFHDPALPQVRTREEDRDRRPVVVTEVVRIDTLVVATKWQRNA